MHIHILYISSETSLASAYTAVSSLQTILLQALKPPFYLLKLMILIFTLEEHATPLSFAFS